MIIFATMGASTPRLQVVFGMILAGLGMGLLQPVYTVAVQNVAPRAQMGAATASTIFFRAIGSTLGVSLFGSVLLTNYHCPVRAHPARRRAAGRLEVLRQSAALGTDASAVGGACSASYPNGASIAAKP